RHQLRWDLGTPPTSRRRGYLHSCAARSSACEMPFSENVSVVWVPLEVWALITASADLRMVSINRASSAAFLTQAPSFWVYIGKPPPPIVIVASVLALKA